MAELDEATEDFIDFQRKCCLHLSTQQGTFMNDEKAWPVTICDHCHQIVEITVPNHG